MGVSEKEKRSGQAPRDCPKDNSEAGSENKNFIGKRDTPEAAGREENVLRYGRERLISSERFSRRRDALSALLSREGEYSVFEAEDIIEKFMKGRVK